MKYTLSELGWLALGAAFLPVIILVRHCTSFEESLDSIRYYAETGHWLVKEADED